MLDLKFDSMVLLFGWDIAISFSLDSLFLKTYIQNYFMFLPTNNNYII